VIDPPAASVETVPVSRVAAAVDVVVVVVAVVVAAREKAPWARRATVVPKVVATERLGREFPAGKSASTRSQRSAARDKVIVAASKWPTVTTITMSTAKAGMSIMRTRATRRADKSNTRTPTTRTSKVALADSATRAANARRKQIAIRSNPSAPRSRRVSRRKRVNRESLVRNANRGKLVSLESLVSRGKLTNLVRRVSPENLASLASLDRSSTTHNPVRVRHRANPLGRASTRRTSSARRPLSLVSHVRQSRLWCGPQPRQATDATSNVS
jgi:hypothetical protein